MKWESWGRYPKVDQPTSAIFWQSQAADAMSQGPLLPVGLGRSYGDVCLNPAGKVLSAQRLNRVLDFDRERGLIRCEAGVSFADLLALIVPANWFLPVSPGTKYVTVGGAVANDIHGKNHHSSGSFGHHVERLALARSDGSVRICSRHENQDWFQATIGGLGLTGLILWVEFKLRPMPSVWIDLDRVRFDNFDEFQKINDESDRDFEYTVAWIDAASGGKQLGRGHFMRGNHAPSGPSGPLVKQPRFAVPVAAPNLLLNPLSIKAFNLAYYWRQLNRRKKLRQHYDGFFYPLDSISHWNRLYGSRGFMQYQCVLPELDQVAELLKRFVAKRLYSFLSVLKKFGDQDAAGWLSFPQSGYTLTMDIPVSPTALQSLQEFDEFVGSHGGRIYPAKDARMSACSFQSFFPRWRELESYRDPQIRSGFWDRVTEKCP